MSWIISIMIFIAALISDFISTSISF